MLGYSNGKGKISQIPRLVVHFVRVQFSPRLLVLIGVLFLGAACAPAPKRITLLVDGERRVFETTAATVQAILQEQGIELGIDDRVDPPVVR